MAARNKPAGIRFLVYGVGKGKAVIEGLSVSRGLVDAGGPRWGRLSEKLAVRF